MKYFHWILVVFLSIGYLQSSAQATISDPNAEVRKTGSFNSVVISSAIDLIISQSSTHAVAVSASEAKYVANITAEVKNNVLYIGYNGSGGWGSKYMRAYVSAPVFYKIAASGACNVKVEGQLTGNDLEINISGSSDFKGTVKFANLKLLASGSSDFIIDGTADNLRINVNGASDVKAFDLVSNYCDIEASGASDVQITANKELKIAASGASDVLYKGSANIKAISTSGASDVKKKS